VVVFYGQGEGVGRGLLGYRFGIEDHGSDAATAGTGYKD